MRLETVRMVAAWLQDDTNGVAAKLAALPLDGTDARPTTIAAASIIEETTSVRAAYHRFRGLTLPGLIITGVGVRHLDPEIVQLNAYADAEVTVQIRYAERTIAAAEGLASGDYVTRAVIASLRELNDNAHAAARTRNGIHLISCTELIEQGIYEEVDDAWVVAAVQVTYLARTIYPMGA